MVSGHLAAQLDLEALDGVHGVLHHHEGVVVGEVAQLQVVLQRPLELSVVRDGAAEHNLCRKYFGAEKYLHSIHV